MLKKLASKPVRDTPNMVPDSPRGNMLEIADGARAGVFNRVRVGGT